MTGAAGIGDGAARDSARDVEVVDNEVDDEFLRCLSLLQSARRIIWGSGAYRVLLKLCLLNDLEEDLRESTRAGIHFPGHLGFNLERWGFWKRGLEELRSSVSIEVAPSVEQAIG